MGVRSDPGTYYQFPESMSLQPYTPQNLIPQGNIESSFVQQEPSKRSSADIQIAPQRTFLKRQQKINRPPSLKMTPTFYYEVLKQNEQMSDAQDLTDRFSFDPQREEGEKIWQAIQMPRSIANKRDSGCQTPSCHWRTPHWDGWGPFQENSSSIEAHINNTTS